MLIHSSICHHKLNLYLHSIGFLKSLPLSAMEITLVILKLNTFSPFWQNLSASRSSHSLWVPLQLSSQCLTASKIWLNINWTALICGSRRLKNPIDLIIFSQIFTMLSGLTLNMHSNMTSIWLLRNLTSIIKLLQRCNLSSLSLPGFSKSLRRTLITSLKIVREGSEMNSLYKCFAAFSLMTEVLLDTEQTSNRCFLSVKVL